MGAKVSKKLLDLLSKFLMLEIQSRVLDGITYTFLFKDGKDAGQKEKYLEIRDEAAACGFKPEEVFRIFEVSNGYILDMDLSIAKYITEEISKVVARENNYKTPVGDLIGNRPEKRRIEDMEYLAKVLLKHYKDKEKEVEVALFSRNRVPKIVLTAEDTKGGTVVVKYDAFAIRHWDLEDVNTNLLIPKGVRITDIVPCEILPSKTGVRFIIKLKPSDF